MNGFLDTEPASDKPCSLCGRTHRKLKRHGNLWLGTRCEDDLRFAHRLQQSAELAGTDLSVLLQDYFSTRRIKQLQAALS